MRTRIRRLRARAAAASIDFPLPTRALAELFPGAEWLEVTLLPRLLRRHEWAMPESELAVLGALCRALQPRSIVEFGTFTGGSTLMMAANTPPQARIITVDLDPSTRAAHRDGLGTGIGGFEVGELFRESAYANKIEQRYANTQEFDATSLAGSVDFLFLDGDHTYDFVRSDTDKALRMLRPGGTLLWHDYTWGPEHVECAGVTRCVNEFWRQHGGCFRIADTRFAIHLDARA